VVVGQALQQISMKQKKDTTPCALTEYKKGRKRSLSEKKEKGIPEARREFLKYL